MTTLYKCEVHYRDYTEWTYNPPQTHLWNPLDYKCFDGDEIQFDGENVTIVDSPVRKNINIPGVLLLENNRTFGRTANKKRLYYKCRPNDTKLPHFLVPFDMPMGFNKNFRNKYVTFYFDHWRDKHPCGILSQNLGDVYQYEPYCEYALYCKQLHDSITPSINKTKKLLIEKPIFEYQQTILNTPDQYGSFENREKDTIISIDPPGCVDRDDAISICTLGDHSYRVSVYIANVWVWLECFDLWDLIGSRVSTVYFPHMKRPMLPTAIGEQLCSLDQDHRRFGFVMDFDFVSLSDGNYIVKNTPTLVQCTLNVTHNYDYEEDALLQSANYRELLKMTKTLDPTVKDSHDVVSHWMLRMNWEVACRMKERKMGIFRTVRSRCPSAPIPEHMPAFLRIWEQQLSGAYQCYASDTKDYSHEVLGLSEYTHFTSPIRRMVDLVNQLEWVHVCICPLDLREKVISFYRNQKQNLDSLNGKMKKIRRLQSDCEMLHYVNAHPECLEKTYDSIVVSNTDKHSTLYIESLKLLTTVKVTQPLIKYDKVKCQLYVFEKEEQMKKKIRVQLLPYDAIETTSQVSNIESTSNMGAA
jgi:exoribonuclease R